MKLQWTLALRYLSGRKLRTFLTTMAIAFGVLIIFGMNTLLPAFMRAFQANAMALSGQVDVTVTNKTGQAFPEETMEKIATIDGLSAYSGRLERVLNLPADYFDSDPAAPDRISAVILTGIDPDQARTTASYNILEGRFLQAGDENAAVISESLADETGVKLNDVLSLPTSTGLANLSIVGLLPQNLLPGNEKVLVTLDQVQKLVEMPGKINVIDINYDSMKEERRLEIQKNIEAALGPNYAIGALQAGAEIFTMVKNAQVILSFFGSLGLLMGGFIILNTFRTIVAERRRDIGMLRAVGASRGMISGLILVEGVIQGVIGAVAGLFLGYVFAWVMLKVVEPIGRQYMNLSLGTPAVTPWLVILSVAIGIGVTLISGWLPARAASRVTPLEALRPSLGEVSFKRMAGPGFWAGVVLIGLAVAALLTNNVGLIGLGAFVFVIGLGLVAAALVTPIARLFGGPLAVFFARDGAASLAEGNLSRQPSRAAITASTTMIALAILLMAASVLSSVSLGFIKILEKSLGSDYLIMPPTVSLWGSNIGAGSTLTSELRAVEGVEVVSSLRFTGSQINNVSVGLLGIEPQAYMQTSGLTFSEGDEEQAFREMENGRAMIINGILAKSTGVKLGDEIAVLTPTGTQTYKIVGIATDFLNAKTNTGYISQANIAMDFDRAEDIFYQINIKPGADGESVEAGFRSILKPYPQFKVISGAEYLEQNRGLFDTAFIGMYAMIVFLSIPSLIAMINTLAIGVIERTREIGMLRAVGATRRQVRSVVLAEALILAAIGVAFGLLSGLYLGYMLVGAFSTFGFPMEYIFPAWGVVIAIAVGLLFGALAAILPARQAARMDVVQALRYE